MDKKELVEWGIKEFANNPKFEKFIEWVCAEW